MLKASDRDIFLQEFGVNATIKNKTIRVLYDSKYMKAAELKGFAGVSDLRSSILVKDEDVVGIEQGEMVEVAGMQFYVAEIMPQGDGFTEIELSEDEI